MARPSRHRPPYVAQGTWRSGALHVWGWNGIDAASMAWLYSGFRRIAADGTRSGWHDSPVSYGAVARISIVVDGQPTIPAASCQLDPLGTAVWLSEVPEGDDAIEVSDSIRWFAAMAEFARRVVGSGRITPIITEQGPFTVASWVPAIGGDPDLADLLDKLTESMPPICTAGSGHGPADIFAQLVDGIARGLLHQSSWRPELGRRRKPMIQALRATFGALAKPDHVVRGNNEQFDAALGRLRDELDRHRRRLDGEPVVTPRLRLLMGNDPHDPWEVRLELVDDNDSMRWCTAADVWDRAEAAVELAGGAQQVDSLGAQVLDLASRVAPVLPGFADLALEHEPASVELTVFDDEGIANFDIAEDFLDQAPFELDRMGLDLIGPERLVKQTVRVTGEATPSPSDDRRSKFGKDALVEWNMVIGDETISETELARAEAAGSTLLHTGDRWVRIDADQLRRQREKLDEFKATKSSVTPLELLQLANDEGATEDAPTIRVHEAGTTVSNDAFSGDLGTHLADVEIGSDPSGRESVGGHDIGLSARDWVSALLEGLPDEELDEATESAGFTGELRHYQRRGLSWMRFLASLGLGGCLADDMGLGKTATTLAHLLERPGPHLVVCPLSVVRNWRNESNRFTPFFEVTVHHGSGRDRGINALVQAAERARTGDEPAEMFAIDPERQLVITTYGLLPRDVEHLGAIDWSTIVLDEAQMVKNPNTKAARAVRQLTADQKLALTGTPVENRLSELWAILDAVNPGMLGSLESFRNTYSGPIERNHDLDAAARLRRLTGPFVLRRTKADKRLLPDLPDKIETIAWAKLTKEQAVLYQQIVDQLLSDAENTDGMKRRGIVLAALMRLKQVCNHPAHALKDGSRLAGRSGKLSRFDELVTDLLDQGERALVFTQFREMGELLVRHVNEQFSMTVPFLHGGVPRTRRDQMVDDFQDGSGSPLLLVSLKAGGTGLNLTAASQVIHYDRWWNPAVEDQATDRAWRLGQTRTVNVHKLVCEGTVEEKVSQVIDEKRALAEQVVGTGENADAWLSELSTDELRDLIVLEDI